MFNFIYYVLFIFSGCYLINILKISPIYIVFLISTAWLIILCINSKIKINFKYVDKLLIILVGYIFITQIKRNEIKEAFQFSFQFVYVLVYRNFLKYQNLKNIKKSINYFYVFNIILLIIETIIRISSSEKSIGNYYNYKFNSIMYIDSNYVGFFILSLITFEDYLIQKKFLKLSNKNRLRVLYFLNLLTFSKSTILTMIIRKQILLKNKLLKYIILITCITIVLYYFNNAWTLQSKFYIIYKIIEYYKNNGTLEELLFGIGLGNTSKLIGIGPHIIFIAQFYEIGIIGGIIFLMLWRAFYLESNKNAKIVIFPLIISGLTLFPGQVPYFYLILSTISKLETYKMYKR